MGHRRNGKYCSKCGSPDETVSEQRFADGRVHLRVCCGSCGKYKRFQSRDTVTDTIDDALSAEFVEIVRHS